MDLVLDTRHTFSEAQEALWADANIDGRAVYSVRETYKLHRGRLIEVQQDVERLRWIVKGCNGPKGTDQGSYESPLYKCFAGTMSDVFSRVAEHIGQNYSEIIKFIASWPVYAEEHLNRQTVLPNEVMHKSEPESTSERIRVFIRKRPLLPFEQQLNEWDVVSIPERSTLTVHEGRVAHSGRRLVMHLAHYTADAVVSKDILSLFRKEVELFENSDGKSGDLQDHAPYLTVLLYGQTGTGKTYTMRELIGEFFSKTPQSHGAGELAFELQCFEVLHKSSTVFDLLDGRKQVKLLEDAHRRVHSKSKRVRVPASEPGKALGVLEGAMGLRMSEATERNAQSSRSHAFFILSTVRGDGEVAQRLRVVDLAGSERNFETQDMTPQQHRQSADINASLMVLKSCLRAIAQRSRHMHATPDTANNANANASGAGGKVPFRESRLTHLLQDCFLEAHPPSGDDTVAPSRLLRSRLIIVATVSPCARDAIHTRNTLNHVCDLGADPEYAIRNCVLDLPLFLFDPTNQRKPLPEWTEDEVSMWLGNVAHGRFARIVLPEGKRDGRGLLSLTPDNLAQMFETETLRNARRSEEGASWNLMATDTVGKLGRLFYRAVQRAKRDSEMQVRRTDE